MPGTIKLRRLQVKARQDWIAAQVAKRLRETGPPIHQIFQATEDIVVDQRGRAQIHIYPAIIPTGQYQNVEDAPADNALICAAMSKAGDVLPFGSPGNWPMMNGAQQAGSMIDTDGWNPGETMRKGDWFQISGVYQRKLL